MSLGMTDQVRVALLKQNRIAALIGGWLSKLAPIGAFAIAHFAPLDYTTPRGVYLWCLLAGCLAFSAPKAFKWGRTTFDSWLEGAGFVVLAEGLSLAPHDVHWFLTFVSFDALLILLVINTTTGAVRVALDQKETRAAAREPVPVVTTQVIRPNPGEWLSVVPARKRAAKMTAQKKGARR
jgi:hypothetical protein